jgi:hypothetical protein
LLERASAEPVEFHHTVRTHLALERAYTKLGQPARAKTVRHELRRKVMQRFPKSGPALERMLDRAPNRTD